eukprot:90318-Chlamydomonas_euryale.AAC.5
MPHLASPLAYSPAFWTLSHPAKIPATLAQSRSRGSLINPLRSICCDSPAEVDLLRSITVKLQCIAGLRVQPRKLHFVAGLNVFALHVWQDGKRSCRSAATAPYMLHQSVTAPFMLLVGSILADVWIDV